MAVYKIKYMHGDADAYTNESFNIKEEYKNEIIKEILKIFENTRPDWRENFLYEIDESSKEEYLIDNYDEDEDSPELWNLAETELRKDRANKFLNILKDALDKNSITNEYELKRVKEFFSIEENSIEKNEFYKKLFNLVWDISDIYEMLVPDATCEDRFAKIERIQIKYK